jgi:hypothetical protein
MSTSHASEEAKADFVPAMRKGACPRQSGLSPARYFGASYLADNSRFAALPKESDYAPLRMRQRVDTRRLGIEEVGDAALFRVLGLSYW